jgi:hypothetical protein
VVSIEGDILELFDYLSASEIWPDKRGSFWWSDRTRGELFSKRVSVSSSVNDLYTHWTVSKHQFVKHLPKESDIMTPVAEHDIPTGE